MMRDVTVKARRAGRADQLAQRRQPAEGRARQGAADRAAGAAARRADARHRRRRQGRHLRADDRAGQARASASCSPPRSSRRRCTCPTGCWSCPRDASSASSAGGRRRGRRSWRHRKGPPQPRRRSPMSAAPTTADAPVTAADLPATAEGRRLKAGQPALRAARVHRADRPDHRLRAALGRLPDLGQPRHDDQARRDQRDPRHRDADGHPHRRHRPLGRLDRRPRRHRRRRAARGPAPRVRRARSLYPPVWAS